ncbi:MAG: hypothetical protein WC627_03215 [Legionella sp.]|jgi:hypothetical protein
MLTIENYNQLVAEFNQLKQTYSPDFKPDLFGDKVIYAFYQWVISKITPILSQEPIDLPRVEHLLQQFLKEYRSFAVGSIVSPLALPCSDVISCICKIATYVCGDKQPVQMLYEHVSYEAVRDPYTDLDKTIPLQSIIKNHILSDDGTTLIPIKCITDEKFLLLIKEGALQQLQGKTLEQGTLGKECFINPYSASYDVLTPNEANRLIEHSLNTKELDWAYENFYQLSQNNRYDLYSQLERLCRLLGKEDSHTGVGTDEKVGEGAFSPISCFAEFYDKLSEDKKEKIPSRVMEAINNLFEVSSSWKEGNPNLIDKCVGNIKEKIKKSMVGNETILINIGLDEQKIALDKRETMIRAHNCARLLMQSIDDGKYDKGYEKLGFSYQLLRTLNVDCSIATYKELEQIKALTAKEIEEILTNFPSLQDNIVNVIGNLENFVIITQTFSLEQLVPLMKIIADKLKNKYINSSREFSALINSQMSPEKLCLLEVCFNQGYNIQQMPLTQVQKNILTQWQLRVYNFRQILSNYPVSINEAAIKKEIIENPDSVLKAFAFSIYVNKSPILKFDIIKIFLENGVRPVPKLFDVAIDYNCNNKDFETLIKYTANTQHLNQQAYEAAYLFYMNQSAIINSEVIKKFFDAGISAFVKDATGQSIFHKLTDEKFNSVEVNANNIIIINPDKYFKIISYAQQREGQNNRANWQEVFNYYLEKKSLHKANPKIVLKYLEMGLSIAVPVFTNFSLQWTNDNLDALLIYIIKHENHSKDDLEILYSDYINNRFIKYLKLEIIELFFKARINPLFIKGNNKPLFSLLALKQTTAQELVKFLHLFQKYGLWSSGISQQCLGQYLESIHTPSLVIIFYFLNKGATITTEIFNSFINDKWPNKKILALITYITKNLRLDGRNLTEMYNTYMKKVEEIDPYVIEIFFKNGVSLLTIDTEGKSFFYHMATKNITTNDRRELVRIAIQACRNDTNIMQKGLSDYLTAGASPEVFFEFLKTGGPGFYLSIFEGAIRNKWSPEQFEIVLEYGINLKNVSVKTLQQAYRIYISQSPYIQNAVLKRFYEAGVDSLTTDTSGKSIFYRAARNSWTNASYIELIRIVKLANQGNTQVLEKALCDYFSAVSLIDCEIALEFIELKGAHLSIEFQAINSDASGYLLLIESKKLNVMQLTELLSSYINTQSHSVDASVLKAFLDAGANPLLKLKTGQTLFYRLATSCGLYKNFLEIARMLKIESEEVIELIKEISTDGMHKQCVQYLEQLIDNADALIDEQSDDRIARSLINHIKELKNLLFYAKNPANESDNEWKHACLASIKQANKSLKELLGSSHTIILSMNTLQRSMEHTLGDSADYTNGLNHYSIFGAGQTKRFKFTTNEDDWDIDNFLRMD